MKYLKIIIAGLLVFGPFAANADVIYEDYDVVGVALGDGGPASVAGTLDLINDVNDPSFDASGYPGVGGGIFNDNLGFPLGTATSAAFYMWIQYGADITLIETNLAGIFDAGGAFVLSFKAGTLDGTLLGNINATGTLDWEVSLSGLTPTGMALIDAVGLVVTTPDVVAAVPEPGTLALLGLGLAGMGMTRRKKKV